MPKTDGSEPELRTEPRQPRKGGRRDRSWAGRDCLVRRQPQAARLLASKDGRTVGRRQSRRLGRTSEAGPVGPARTAVRRAVGRRGWSREGRQRALLARLVFCKFASLRSRSAHKPSHATARGLTSALHAMCPLGIIHARWTVCGLSVSSVLPHSPRRLLARADSPTSRCATPARPATAGRQEQLPGEVSAFEQSRVSSSEQRGCKGSGAAPPAQHARSRAERESEPRRARVTCGCRRRPCSGRGQSPRHSEVADLVDDQK